MSVTAGNGWLYSSSYIFTPEDGGTTWVWDQPNWDMPEQDKGNFVAYLSTQMLLHDFTGVGTLQKDGLSHQVLALMRDYCLQYAPEVLVEVKDEFGLTSYIIPAEVLSQLIYYFYGIENFDVTTLPAENYNIEAGGVEIHAYCDHGSLYNSMVVFSVEPQANGDIKMIADHVFGAEGGSSRQEQGYVERFQQLLFRPITTKEGVPMYAIISSEDLPDYIPASRENLFNINLY